MQQPQKPFAAFSIEVITEQELHMLMMLIDAGVKHAGINAAVPAAVWVQKINAAAAGAAGMPAT